MDNQGFAPRQMFQGNWKCSKCEGDITELPFEPDPSRLDQLLCRDCWSKQKKNQPPKQF